MKIRRGRTFQIFFKINKIIEKEIIKLLFLLFVVVVDVVAIVAAFPMKK